VHFYIVGEVVRRILSEAGEPPYTPYLDALNLFERLRDPIKSAWEGYLNGTRSMPESATALVGALTRSGR